MKSFGYAYVLLEEGARMIFLQGGPKFEVTPLERGRIQGLPKICGYPVISGTVKATDFKFCMHIYGLNREK